MTATCLCSAMHSIGKLLHGKRHGSEQPKLLRGKLSFDPELVIESSPFDADTAVTFLQHNLVDGA